ncbi:MAG TPA: lytic transglycosylase domain-containing protein [Candidatus Angelobacter sp.]|nr:lytic transglycosylase domain-containing protein [Candidatus Angelobacter sp.]
MRIFRPIAIGMLLAGTQLPAFAGEIAVLRNGFTIHFDRKEQQGNSTRLYTGTGYLDIASDQIESFEAEEAPVIPPPQPQSQPAIQTAAIVPAAATAETMPPAKAAPAVDLDQMVREASNRNRIDPDFVSSVIKAESNFKPRAVSKKGAQGLMQLMPGTAAQLGVTDPFDPRANVEAGTAHLSALLDQYHNDPIKALAAYNAGAHRVKQYNGVPPYRETRAYINKIVRDFNAKKRAQMKTVAATKAAVPARTTKANPVKKARPQQASVPKSVSPA